MIDKVETHLKAVEQFAETTPEAIEAFRIKYAGKKGILNELFAAFRDVKNEEKKAYGQVLNQLKTAVSEKVEALKSASTGGEKPIVVLILAVLDILSILGINTR